MKVRMRTRQTVATSVLLLMLLGVAGTVQSFAPQSRVATSPEVGFTSLSPRGAAGGAIVPASCESGYDHVGVCSSFTFTADSYTVAYNTGTTLRWSLAGNASAYVLRCNAAGGPWGGFKTAPVGAEGTIGLTSATAYTITCSFEREIRISSDSSYLESWTESKSVTINVNPPNACYPGANPAGYGSACSSSANACGQTQANGTIQCNGSCSSTPPGLPAGYGSACTSAPNACGQTRSNGTIQCNGSCSSTPPPGSNCSPELSAGSTTASPSSGTTGASESFSATVSNTGAGPASNFPNIFQIVDSAFSSTIAMLNAGTVPSLGSGASTGISGAYTFSSAGSYNVRACANYNTSWGGSVTETNLNNNCGAWLPLTVSWAACTNGANNPPSCNQCPSNLAYVSGSCIACSNGGCTGTPGGSASNPIGSLVCNNGAINPPSCNAFVPTATLSASPTTINQGQSSSLIWGSTNATACVGTGFTAGGPSGTRSTGTLNTAGTNTYQVVCSGTGGSSPPAFASVEVLAPDATISASPARVQSGTNSEISWSAVGVVSCVVTGPSGTLASGNANGSHSFSTGSPVSATISAQSTFTITCETNSSPITRSVTVNLLTDFEEF